MIKRKKQKNTNKLIQKQKSGKIQDFPLFFVKKIVLNIEGCFAEWII
jgi:hypothetical protein